MNKKTAGEMPRMHEQMSDCVSDYRLSRTIVCTLLCLFVCMFAFGFANQSYADSFVPSISSKGAPDVVEAVDAGGKDVSDKLVVTPYSKKEDLSEKKKDRLEKAFDDVKEKDLAEKINRALKDGAVAVPERWGNGAVTLDGEELSVTDIFYIHEKNDSDIIQLGVEMVITTNIPENQMVVVMYYGENGWEVVPCKRDSDGNVRFMVEHFGPYMIVTNTVVEVAGDGESVPASPQTGYDEDSEDVNAMTQTGCDDEGVILGMIRAFFGRLFR